MNDPDLFKTREARRLAAKERAAVASAERFETLRAAERARRPSAGPSRQSAKDWHGTCDAVSLPIREEQGAKPFMTGEDNDWLFPIGAGSDRNSPDGVLPRQLAVGGWVLLRAGDRLVAKVRFVGPEWRDQRVEHIPSETGVHEDAGAGHVLRVDPSTWEEMDQPLAGPQESGNGYRYYRLIDDRFEWVRVGGKA